MWRKNKKIKKYDNDRINLVFAIVFLIGASIIYKLYILQIKDYGLYIARAQGQHQTLNVLTPKRGGIFIQDNLNNNQNLYPIATNKKFAFLYSVPKNVTKADELSEILYTFFKKEDIEKDIEETFKKEDEERLKKEIDFVKNSIKDPRERLSRAIEVKKEHEERLKDEKFLELRQLKREKEINTRKEENIQEYLSKLNKKKDPYEPLENKVSEEKLKELYLALLPITNYSNIFGEKYNFDNRTIDELLEGIDNKKLEIKDNAVIAECSDGIKRKINLDGISFITKTYRFYPESNVGAHILGLVKTTENGQFGEYGLEGFFNSELKGISSVAYTDYGAKGDLIVVNGHEYIKPRDGDDLILTIDPTIQFYICRKLNEKAEFHEADSATVIVMEPQSGAIISMCSWPDYDPNNYRKVEDINVYNNPAIFFQYEPGSVFKTFSMAASIDKEKITPKTTYTDKGFIMIEGWDKPIRNADYEDVGGHGVVDMNTVLEKSLNTGAIYAMRQAGRYEFAQYVRDFGFGEKTGIELDTEVAGDIRKISGDKIYEIYAATASFGQGITTTPLQLITAYAALANGGILMKSHLVKEIIHPDGSREEIKPKQIRRVVSERTAMLIGGMLGNVVEGGHAKEAAVPGYYVGGKTGTAQIASTKIRGYTNKTAHTFIGYAPIDDPKFVMLVKIDNPKEIQYSSKSAAPLFGEIAKFLLTYLQVPKERK